MENLDMIDAVENNLRAIERKVAPWLARLQREIKDDYRASEYDTEPSMQITVACNDDASKYDGQTGDNSYTGNAYGYPHWAVVSLYRDSDAKELAHDIGDQLADLIAGSN
jgi:hypothetical protein